jgi:alanine-synthesizing transaminase
MARVPANLTVNATTRAIQRLRAEGVHVIDLTASNPTRVGLAYPDDLLAPLGEAAALTYEPDPLGLPSTRAAIVDEYARRGLAVPAEAIVVTASTSEAYSWLFKLLCDPGDNVLIPQPGYPLFEHLSLLEGVEARPYRLEFNGTWRVDLEHLRSALDARTKAIVVVSPGNPTGAVLHADDLRALDELCAARHLMLIGDEVFADYPLDPHPHGVSVLHAPAAVVCSLGGLSKSIGLPQVKLGWIAMAGHANQVAPLRETLELIADTFLSVSTPAQMAAPQLLARGADVRRQIQERLARNLAALRAIGRDAPAVSVLPVEGGWSVTLRVPRYRSDEALVLELLTRDHVLVHPGYFFDFEQDGYLVVSLLAAPAEFDRGIRRVLDRVSARDTV